MTDYSNDLYPADTYAAVSKRKLDAGELDAALLAALKGQDSYPNDPRMKIAIARVHMAAGRFVGALRPLHQAEALDPSNLTTLLLLAECNNRRDNPFEAERYYRKVLAIVPDHIEAIVNLEPIIREQGRNDEVRALLSRLHERLPTLAPSIATSLACLDLTEGNLVEGFEGYEHRFEGFAHLGAAYGTPLFPRWDGKADLMGRSVLLRFEQGLGDTIQFVRYAKTLHERGANRIGVLCKSPLHRLIETNDFVSDVFDRLPLASSYDFEVMMMSMPALLLASGESAIPETPYFSIPAADKFTWANKIAPFCSGRPRVGLVWSGELKRAKWFTERMNLRRSIPLDMFRPLLDADCDFFALQKGERQADLKDFVGRLPIHDVMDQATDFYDTACLIANLDLVIAVDTSTAHVAGALGKPVWMLSRLDGCWRWMLNRSDSPWYSSMTIYRQETYRDWHATITSVSKDLVAFAQHARDHQSTAHRTLSAV